MSTPSWWEKAEVDIHSSVAHFSDRVRAKLSDDPGKIVATKNPFLFRARVSTDASLLSRMIVDAFLSSSEETMFGNVLEEIAIDVCSHAKGGRKSSTESMDLEYDEGRKRTIVQIKSGPKWGNARQKKALVSSFNTARQVVRQGRNVEVRCVEGICYGPSETKDLGTHWRLIGNDFWFDISGWYGSARGVFNIIGEHAGNGLEEAREIAYRDMVSFLRSRGAVTVGGQVKWDSLLDLVMTKGGKSSEFEQPGLPLQ